ncbi:DUF732 domain-containing protein [Spirillospora sp. NPDC050679]
MNVKKTHTVIWPLSMSLAVLAGCGGVTQNRANPAAVTSTVAPTPTATRTVTAKPAPTVTKTIEKHIYRDRALPDVPSGSFVDDYESAGIRAPSSWAVSTAQEVCTAWLAGRSRSSTDSILLDGGIYADHLRSFSDTIETWFCPGAQP